MRIAVFPVFILFFAMVLSGCGGPAVTHSKVMRSSVDLSTNREDLPEVAAPNVQVLTEIPEQRYTLIDSGKTYFEYQKNSVSYRKIEKKKIFAELRDKAGRMGGNAIIVKTLRTMDAGGAAARETMAGGGSSYFLPRQGTSSAATLTSNQVALVSSDNLTIEELEVFVIYLH